jgi:hypothetical protein
MSSLPERMQALGDEMIDALKFRLSFLKELREEVRLLLASFSAERAETRRIWAETLEILRKIRLSIIDP